MLAVMRHSNYQVALLIVATIRLSRRVRFEPPARTENREKYRDLPNAKPFTRRRAVIQIRLIRPFSETTDA